MGETPTEAVREVYEPCCESGAVVAYRNLRLEKLGWSDRDHSQWRVYREGDHIDTIGTAAFRSARELEQWLDAVALGGASGVEFCGSCPLSLPGD